MNDKSYWQERAEIDEWYIEMMELLYRLPTTEEHDTDGNAFRGMLIGGGIGLLVFWSLAAVWRVWG